jgi:cobyrinic acid a,c-diamide synthase
MTAARTVAGGRRAACRGVVVAAPSSGAGKTTLALGIVAALRARGLRVQPFKAGPDFIDAGHLARVAARTVYNLDTFLTSPDYVVRLVARATRDADVALLEGMMGLFDGVDGASDRGSTAELAALLGWPVLLVIDASAAARSVAAVVRGFRTFSTAIDVAAVVFNRIGGAGHLRMLADACAGEGIALLGGLPSDPRVTIAERHLGLHLAAESTAGGDRQLGELIEAHLDLDALLRCAGPSPPAPPARTRLDAATRSSRAVRAPSAVRCRVAVARDAAFAFYYEDNLELMRAAGAALVDWSPLADELPSGVDGLYLGGGYPELHLARLGTAAALHAAIRRFAAQGGMIYAECGGFMFLQRAIRPVDGAEVAMVGLLPGVAAMRPRLAALGYRELGLTIDGCSVTARGQEFRYSELVDWPDPAVLDGEVVTSLARGPLPAGPVGPIFAWRRVVAGYVHLHFASAPRLAELLVARAAAFRSERG